MKEGEERRGEERRREETRGGTRSSDTALRAFPAYKLRVRASETPDRPGRMNE